MLKVAGMADRCLIPKIYCKAIITWSVLVGMICLYCILSRDTSNTAAIGKIPHEELKNMYRNTQRQCHGHFYLCSIRSLFYENKLYGNIAFPDNDIYNFSRLIKFSTSFFKTGHNSQLGMDILVIVDEIMKYMTKEFKELWFTRNLEREYQNLTTHWRLCSLNPLQYFNYTVQFVEMKMGHPTKAVFSVSESRQGTHLNYVVLPYIYGPALWSNVYADVNTPRTRASCVTIDYIKGTYFIECPLLESEFVITITGSYLAPSVHDYKCTNNDTWLIHNYTNHDVKEAGLVSNGINYPSLSKCTTRDTKHPGFWIKIENVWHWSTGRCFYPFTFDQKKKECLRKTTVFSLGDSHLRYRTWALSRYHIVNGTHETIGFASHMNDQLVEYIPQMKNSPNPVVILNSGHWPYAYTDAASYMSEMMDTFELLSSLMIIIPEVKFIWVETTSLPYNNYHSRWRVTAFIAAMNDWINHHMERIGVEVIPAYEISHPMRMQTRDGIHYFELLEEDVFQNNEKVSVGGAIASVLINSICASVST